MTNSTNNANDYLTALHAVADAYAALVAAKAAGMDREALEELVDAYYAAEESASFYSAWVTLGSSE